MSSKASASKKTPAKRTASKKLGAKKVSASVSTKQKKTAIAKAKSQLKAASDPALQVVDVVARGKQIDLNFIGSKEESAEARNVASRVRVRGQLDADVEAFLSSGGTIASIEPNVMADPPRKPESNYGSRPI